MLRLRSLILLLPLLIFAAPLMATPDGQIRNSVAVCDPWNPLACFIQADVSTSFTPTVQNAAYAASNAMGGLQTINIFRQAANPKGILNNFWIASKAGNTTAMTVYIFEANPTATTCTDKSAFVLGAADIGKLAVAPFVITPAVPQGATMAIGQQTMAASIANIDTTLTTNLYVCIVANGAVTPGSTTDLVFSVGLSQD